MSVSSVLGNIFAKPYGTVSAAQAAAPAASPEAGRRGRPGRSG